ncbi:MAG: CT253 family lipoprotein [Chlamydiota bacterium]
MRYLSASLLALSLFGCSRNNDEMSRFHEDGRAKPVVAVASMIDTTSFDTAWSLSEEFTSMIVGSLSKSGELFVEGTDDDSFVENPFGTDLSWVKHEFQSKEFAVFLELVEHEAAPVIRSKKNVSHQELSVNLNMAVRVRVIDLRGSQPKIVLQEMVRDSYFIPKTLLPTDYSEAVWGTAEYRKSPMGIAHSQLGREIANRISEYILLAKSR